MKRLIFSIAFLGAATVASAQQVGPGWSAFVGCWTPVGADGSRNVAANTPKVCVMPNGSNAVDLLTIVNDSITQRSTVDASGTKHDVSKQGCSGWEKAEFSADGRRLFMTGEQTCVGGLKRKTSGIFAMTSNGDWVNAVDVAADSVSSVRVMRYSGIPASAVPANLRASLDSLEAARFTSRISAQRDVSVNAVIEASRFLSPAAEEAWLAELEQDFNLDDNTLERLAKEGVAPSTIDVMVAVSNPDLFSVRPTGAVTRDADTDSARVRRQYQPCFSPVIDPWAWYAYDPCDPYLRYSYYRPYSYRYGYPGYGFGYSPYYYPYDSRPVIIVPVSSNPREHGRMTKDGYKPSGSSSSGTGATTSRGGETRGESTGKSSGDNGRTATRKPPARQRSEGAERPSTPRTESSSSQSKPATTSSSSGSSSSSSSGSSSGRVATRKPPTG